MRTRRPLVACLPPPVPAAGRRVADATYVAGEPTWARGQRRSQTDFLGRCPSLAGWEFQAPESNPIGLRLGSGTAEGPVVWPNPSYVEAVDVVRGRLVDINESEDATAIEYLSRPGIEPVAGAHPPDDQRRRRLTLYVPRNASVQVMDRRWVTGRGSA